MSTTERLYSERGVCGKRMWLYGEGAIACLVIRGLILDGLNREWNERLRDELFFLSSFIEQALLSPLFG